MARRRSYGSGRLYERVDKNGKTNWYGSWYVGTRRVNRKVGLKRIDGTREGLTKVQAERKLQSMMETDRVITRSGHNIGDVGRLYIDHLEHIKELQLSTLGDYRSMVGRHFEPFFGDRPIERIDSDAVQAFLIAKKRENLSNKTIRNLLTFLHGLFQFAIKSKWTSVNPVDFVDRPPASRAEQDLQFFNLSEIEALLRHATHEVFGLLDRCLYMVASMAGLRQSELIALRWIDIDWEASRIRVRRKFTRQRFGVPKSRRSSRSVPMTDRVAGALARRFQESPFQDDHDLVFAHPRIGSPLDPNRLRRRYKEARDSAGLRPIRFHDLRHTFGTRCAAKGIPMRTLQEWMGHAKISTTEIYSHYAPSAHEKQMIEEVFEPTDHRALPGLAKELSSLGMMTLDT